MPPQSIRGPDWHFEAQTRVVEGKYIDRTTGKFLVDHGGGKFAGPLAVDIIIKSQHAQTAYCTVRAQRPYSMETILCHLMKVVEREKLQVDSVMATTYSIRVILSHELTREGSCEGTDDMLHVE